MGDNEVERLKALTLDLLVGNGGCWMEFYEISCVHKDCDGDVDETALREALDALVSDGSADYDSAHDEYRRVRPQEGESLADKVKRLEAEVERLRARDAKLIADLKAVDSWTGNGDAETLDPLARRLWRRVDVEGVEVAGTAYVARTLLEDIEQLEAMNQRLDAECLALAADAQHALEERDRLRAEQAADRAAVKALTDVLPQTIGLIDPAAKFLSRMPWEAPLRALQTLMATWPSDGEESEAPRSARCATDASCAFDHDASACYAVHNPRFVLRSPDEVLEIALKHSARLKSEAQPRYVGEFGDIDEPSVGDVEGYGVRR